MWGKLTKNDESRAIEEKYCKVWAQKRREKCSEESSEHKYSEIKRIANKIAEQIYRDQFPYGKTERKDSFCQEEWRFQEKNSQQTYETNNSVRSKDKQVKCSKDPHIEYKISNWKKNIEAFIG